MASWFANQPTRRKLLLGFGLLILILLAVILAAGMGIASLRETQVQLTNTTLPIEAGLHEFRGDLNRQHGTVLEMILMTSRAEQEAKERDLRTFSAKVDTDLARLESLAARDAVALSRITEIRRLVAEYRVTREEQISAIFAGNPDRATELAIGTQLPRIDRMRQIALDMAETTNTAAQQSAADAERLAGTLLALMAVLGLVALLAAVLLIRTLSQGIATPLVALADVNRRIAGGDLSATYSPDGREDEIGTLGTATAEMLDGLRSMTTELRGGVTVLASSVQEITTTMSQLATAAQETATAIAETTTTAEEVRQTTTVASQKAREVSERAGRAAESMASGRHSVDETVAAIGRTREQMDAIGAAIDRLNERTQAIGEIIAVVDDVADQVNILSVNASIEAARAGDEGRGFGVVAREIRALAEQSRRATEQVQTHLREIQRSVTAAVMAVEHGNRVVQAGVRQAATTGEAIRALEDLNAESAEAAVQIAATSQEQQVGMDQVAVAMEDIRTASAQNVESAREGQQVARNLAELGDRLQQLMERYRGI